MFPHCPDATKTTELWCAHLPGDDVIATVSHEEAQKIVDRVNGTLKWANDMNPSPFNAPADGHTCPWVGSVDTHRAQAMTFASWEEREKAEWS